MVDGAFSLGLHNIRNSELVSFQVAATLTSCLSKEISGLSFNTMHSLDRHCAMKSVMLALHHVTTQTELFRQNRLLDIGIR